MPENEFVLGINHTKDGYQVATQLPTGHRVLKTFGTGLTPTTRKLTVDELILHGVAPEIIVGSLADYVESEPYKPNRSLRSR